MDTIIPPKGWKLKGKLRSELGTAGTLISKKACRNLRPPKLQIIDPHDFMIKPECTREADCECQGKGCVVRATKPEPEEREE